jgi:hypothetical protein
VRRHKAAPGSPAENKRSPAAWSDRTESFYEYPEDLAGCGPISDPALIFQIVSSLDPVSRQDPFEICVFGKKQLHRLTIRQEKSTPLKVSYTTRSASHEAAVEEEISPVVYAITTENILDKKREPEPFSLLGLHKDIRIYLEPDKLIPVSISGTNNSVGKLYLLLQHAELNR